MRKLAIFAFSFSAAVFLAQYFGGMVPLLLGLAAGAVSFFMKQEGRRLRTILLLAGFFAGLGYNTLYARIFQEPARALDGQVKEITAEAADYAQKTGYGSKITVLLLGEGSGKIRTVLYGDESLLEIQPGDRIETNARLSVSFLIDDTDVTTFTSRGVFLLAYQKGEATILPADSIPIRYYPAVMAKKLGGTMGAIFGEAEAPFMKALLLGDRGELSDPFSSALSVSGLSHTVAVSGMHIAALVGFILLISRRRRRAALFAIPLILLFMAVVGNTPSVARAGIMQIMILLAPALGREEDPPTTLSFALLLILLQNPFAAAGIGLQLSFAAIAGIALFSPKIYLAIEGKKEREKGLKRKAVRFLAASVSSTLGAMAFTTPLVAVYFDTVSLVAPIANFLCLWAVSFVFVGGLIATLAGLIWLPLGTYLAFIVSLGTDYLLFLIPRLAKFPFAAVYTVSVYVRVWLVYVYLTLGLCILGRVRKRGLLLFGSAAAVGLCLAVLLPSVQAGSTELTVSALDVGQGESILFTSRGTCMLVDCGGNSPDDPGDTAAERLASMGRSRLDLLVLTHYDSDHVNGLPVLLSRMEVTRLLVPDTYDDAGVREEILSLAEEAGTEVLFVTEDTILRFGNAEATVFAPLSGGSDNEAGLAVLCSAGSFDVLITGDMSISTEERLLRNKTLPDIEVLVAGHHGSKNSTGDDLLSETDPEIAIISVGRNSYGHPAEETLERLSRHQVRIFRTDTMGTVTVNAGES
ncbi:DNA internalization-related competence protein ComEC/Rec2 [Papillibacter cinnamivorans]|uniref:Competence protein ComEC n=1 Tax=Papillibacter cinnamivorans DSM 12816 TaxID=1122930 RepID=A0A1W1ZGX8_9FIRM|nr:DNA internalization-related competence protein ComEC/Rec2 [Papillibacter cinnamivorans]SMC47795.1 competence protein ComEC [Papillibacter cinnamivorans DSM 12816]